MGSGGRARRHVKIDGDTRDGTLFAESASHYIGTRRTSRGTFEERKFEGKEWQVKQEWREWRDETVKRETIHVDSVRSRSMGAKRHSAERPIAGNTSEGRLYTTGVYKCYIGERRLGNGKFETKQFNMSRADATAAWNEWRAELEELEESTDVTYVTEDKTVETEEAVDMHEETEVAAKTQPAKTQPTRAKQEQMYVLSFKANRVMKTIAAFHDMDTALRMAEALTAALDVAGQDGEYDVSDIEVWG